MFVASHPCSNITIPATFVTKSTGDALKALMKGGQPVYVVMDWQDILPKKQQVGASLGASAWGCQLTGCMRGGGTCRALCTSSSTWVLRCSQLPPVPSLHASASCSTIVAVPRAAVFSAQDAALLLSGCWWPGVLDQRLPLHLLPCCRCC